MPMMLCCLLLRHCFPVKHECNIRLMSSTPFSVAGCSFIPFPLIKLRCIMRRKFRQTLLFLHTFPLLSVSHRVTVPSSQSLSIIIIQKEDGVKRGTVVSKFFYLLTLHPLLPKAVGHSHAIRGEEHSLSGECVSYMRQLLNDRKIFPLLVVRRY